MDWLPYSLGPNIIETVWDRLDRELNKRQETDKDVFLNIWNQILTLSFFVLYKESYIPIWVCTYSNKSLHLLPIFQATSKEKGDQKSQKIIFGKHCSYFAHKSSSSYKL